MNIEAIQTGTPSQSVKQRPVSQAQVTSSPPVPATTKVQDQGNGGLQQKALSVEDAVKHLSDFVSQANSEISFSIDQASGESVVKIMDTQTNEVIRQMPSEEAIQIAHALDKLQGLFVKDKA